MRSESEMRPVDRNITLSQYTTSARTCGSGGSGSRRAAIISKFSLSRSLSNLDADSRVSTVLNHLAPSDSTYSFFE
jgi:hypothetical protein